MSAPAPILGLQSGLVCVVVISPTLWAGVTLGWCIRAACTLPCLWPLFGWTPTEGVLEGSPQNTGIGCAVLTRSALVCCESWGKICISAQDWGTLLASSVEMFKLGWFLLVSMYLGWAQAREMAPTSSFVLPCRKNRDGPISESWIFNCPCFKSLSSETVCCIAMHKSYTLWNLIISLCVCGRTNG